MARYGIDPERSRVFIEGRSSVHPIHTSTDGLQGFVELEVDGDGLVDAAAGASGRLSLETARLSSGKRLEDRELHKRIDVRRYPTIDGVLDDLAAGEAVGRYTVGGEVSFRGVTRRHEDELTIAVVDDRTVRLEGAHRFDVRDHGMEPPRVLMLKVEPEVDVRIEVLAVREP